MAGSQDGVAHKHSGRIVPERVICGGIHHEELGRDLWAERYGHRGSGVAAREGERIGIEIENVAPLLPGAKRFTLEKVRRY